MPAFHAGDPGSNPGRGVIPSWYIREVTFFVQDLSKVNIKRLIDLFESICILGDVRWALPHLFNAQTEDLTGLVKHLKK